MTFEMYVTCRARYELLLGVGRLGLAAHLGLLAALAPKSRRPHRVASISTLISPERRVESLRGAHPEHPNCPGRTERRSIRLDHAFDVSSPFERCGVTLTEHPMKLPPKEKYDEQLRRQSFAPIRRGYADMVRVPESACQSPGGGNAQRTDLSKCAFRLFSIANHTITPRATHMSQPVAPGPVMKLYSKKPFTPLFHQPLVSRR
jgi:hypothetical protein